MIAQQSTGWLAIRSVVSKDALTCWEKWEVMEELSNPWLLIGDVSTLTNCFMWCIMLQVVKCTVNITAVHEYIKNFKDSATLIKSFLACFDLDLNWIASAFWWLFIHLYNFCFVSSIKGLQLDFIVKPCDADLGTLFSSEFAFFSSWYCKYDLFPTIMILG